MQSLRSGDALTAFGGGLHFAGPGCPDHKTADRIDSPGRRSALASLFRLAGQPIGL